MMGPWPMVNCWVMKGVAPAAAVPAKSAASQAWPWRANSLQLVTLNTSTPMPWANSSSAALMTSYKIAPEPSKLTRGAWALPALPAAVAALGDQLAYR